MSGERPLRVLTVIPSMARNTGGPAIGLIQATRSLGPGVRRTILCTDAARPAASRPFRRLSPGEFPDGAHDVDLRVFPTRPPYSFAFSPGLARAIGREIGSADVLTIHSLNLFPQLAAFLHARRTRTPYVVTPHGSLDPWLRRNSSVRKAVTNRIWQDRMLAGAAALHFTTEAEAELAGPVGPGVPRRIVPNGVDTSSFRSLPSGAPFRERVLRGDDGPIVLFVGRVARKKGIDLLIRAFARSGTGRRAWLVIVGPDDEGLRPQLEALAAGEGVADRVRFPGPLYGVERLEAMAAADIWALTSHTENFGNAVVEALAAGLPVIVSTAVNIASDISAADAGVVTTLDVEVIARQLSELLGDDARRRELSLRAREFADGYDWSRVGPRLAELYRAVAAGSVT